MRGFQDFSMRDWSLLVDLPHTTSLRSLGEVHHTTAQNISKIIRRIEDQVGAQIIARTPQGVQCTEAGYWLAELAERVLAPTRSIDLEDRLNLSGQVKARVLTFAARGFLNASMAGAICDELTRYPRPTRMRFVDLSPVEISMAARSHQIEVAIVQSTEAPGPQWETIEIGVMRWAFYARQDHPALRARRSSEVTRSNPSVTTHAPIGLAKLKQLAIVQNCFYEGTRINESNRFLPLKVKTSKLCHSSETTATALSIIKSTDQVAFLPVIAVTQALRAQEIVELNLGLETGESESARQAAESAEIAQKLSANQALYLAYHTERVSQSLRDQLVRRLRAELKSLGG